jgi:Cu/Ag efflux protein CusF
VACKSKLQVEKILKLQANNLNDDQVSEVKQKVKKATKVVAKKAREVVKAKVTLMEGNLPLTQMVILAKLRLRILKTLTLSSLKECWKSSPENGLSLKDSKASLQNLNLISNQRDPEYKLCIDRR